METVLDRIERAAAAVADELGADVRVERVIGADSPILLRRASGTRVLGHQGLARGTSPGYVTPPPQR
jgi:hypothetical protein